MIYNLANDGTPSHPQWYLSEWNSTNINFYVAGESTTNPSNFGVFDGSASGMYDWNVSVSSLSSMTSPPSVIGAYYNDIMLCYSGTLPSGGAAANSGLQSSAPYTYFAINLNASKGTVGSMLWQNTLQAPPGNITVFQQFGADTVNRVFAQAYKETEQWVGFSLDTGKQIWGPVGNETAFDYYGSDFGGGVYGTFADGNFYYSGFGGIVYCYNDLTGQLKWSYGNGGSGNSTASGFNTAYGEYPTYIAAIGNGIVYTITTEHTILNPIYKGALTRAVNATTGQEIWTLSDFTGSGIGGAYAIADGYSTFFNGYDNQIYVVGRGPSATTVTAPNVGVTTSTPITITGTVMDISAGTKQNEQASDFPNGVPVASDASMSQWMSYVYQQQAEPTNFTGVPVQIAVLDSNGNHYPIGTATTNEYGTFSLTWTPPITGNYTVYATFAGNNDYWSSSADAYVYAGASAATPAPTATPLSGVSSENTLIYGIAAIIIVIVIIGAVLALLVTRKHP